METGNQINEMRIEDDSPEKAGVGGSIPSLATMFSKAYSHPKPSFIPFHSKNFGLSRLPGYVWPARLVYACRPSFRCARKNTLPAINENIPNRGSGTCDEGTS